MCALCHDLQCLKEISWIVKLLCNCLNFFCFFLSTLILPPNILLEQIWYIQEYFHSYIRRPRARYYPSSGFTRVFDADTWPCLPSPQTSWTVSRAATSTKEELCRWNGLTSYTLPYGYVYISLDVCTKYDFLYFSISWGRNIWDSWSVQSSSSWYI